MLQFRLVLLLGLLSIQSACVTVNPDGTKLQKASRINVQLGIGYYHQGNLDLANEKLLKAIEQDPESSQAYHAYAVLQNRFLNKEKAEQNFQKAIDLDSTNSEALNNYGVFLCSDGRYEAADKMFLQAVENPLYRDAEAAYTTAAICALKQDAQQTAKAIDYLNQALAVQRNYRPALFKLAEIYFEEKNYQQSWIYLQQFDQFGAPTSKSLWLQIQTARELDENSSIRELASALRQRFPDSMEYELYQSIFENE